MPVNFAWDDPNQEDQNRPLLPLPASNRRTGQPLLGTLNAGAGYQNPGANLPFLGGGPMPTIGPPIAEGQPIPGVTDDQRQQIMGNPSDGLPSPQFSAAGPTPNVPTIQPGQLNALVRGPNAGTVGGTGSAAVPAPGAPPRPPMAPSIFNAGVQSAPDMAIPFNGGAAPAGYRQTIAEGGGPGHLQQILPGEQGPAGQDLRRQGLSLAEVQQANPHLDILQAHAMQQRLQAQNAADQMRTARDQTDTRNRARGIMPNADANAQFNALTERQRADYATNGTAAADALYNQIIQTGGSNTTASRARTAFLASRGIQANTAASQSGTESAAPGTPGVRPSTSPGTPPDDADNPLDQHLEGALAGAGVLTAEMVNARIRGGGQNRAPLVMPAATPEQRANDAITNFVSAVSGSGNMGREQLPSVMNYMMQHFGVEAVDRWFTQGSASNRGDDAHGQAAMQIGQLANVPDANGRSANLGYEPNRATRIGQTIVAPIQRLFQPVTDASTAFRTWLGV